MQAQRHAVVHASDGRETARSLAVASVCVQHGMNIFGGHHPCQQGGTEVVTESSASAKKGFGSCHVVLQGSGWRQFTSELSNRTVLRPDPSAAPVCGNSYWCARVSHPECASNRVEVANLGVGHSLDLPPADPISSSDCGYFAKQAVMLQREGSDLLRRPCQVGAVSMPGFA